MCSRFHLKPRSTEAKEGQVSVPRQHVKNRKSKLGFSSDFCTNNKPNYCTAQTKAQPINRSTKLQVSVKFIASLFLFIMVSVTLRSKIISSHISRHWTCFESNGIRDECAQKPRLSLAPFSPKAR